MRVIIPSNEQLVAVKNRSALMERCTVRRNLIFGPDWRISRRTRVKLNSSAASARRRSASKSQWIIGEVFYHRNVVLLRKRLMIHE